MDAEVEGGVCCEICGSLSFQASDSLFFCLECGTQSQDVREEETGEDIEPSNFVRTLRAPSTKKKTVNNPGRNDGNITLLQKMQLILQKQCDALIALGYDKSVKEAVKHIWFLYLKECGYAFVDDPSSRTPAPVTPLPKKRPREDSDDPLSKKRPREDCDDPLPSLKKPRNGEESTAFDDFPDDDESSAVNQRLSGNDVFVLYRAKRQSKIRNFSVTFTIGLLYLALQYTHQKIMLPDLKRLVATNKIPYHNLHEVLPSHIITARHSISLYAKHQTSSDGIHHASQRLYKFVPLPELPQADPKWVCRTLLERLQLPDAFRPMVEATLTKAYQPGTSKCSRYELMNVAQCRMRRPDMECMALIVMVMKMIYRLDDVQEFEQASKAVSGEDALVLLGTSDYVYPWEDWVTVFCRSMQRTLDASIPLNERELGYVSDKQPFLDFCREDVFPRVRPKERPGNTIRRNRFCPEFYTRVSHVFRRQRERAVEAEEDKAEEDTHQPNEDVYSWDDFTPRVIPCSVLRVNPEDAPWRQYLPIPAHSMEIQQDFERLPKSMVLLLELCSDVVDTTPLSLMQYLKHVEWYIIQKSEYAPKITTKLVSTAEELQQESAEESTAEGSTGSTSDSATEESAAEESVTEESATEESAADSSASEESAGEESATEESAADSSASEESEGEESAADSSAAEESAAKELQPRKSLRLKNLQIKILQPLKNPRT